MNKSSSESTVTNCDVLIVGGGIAGLFAAWRLLSAGNGKYSVVVVEKLGRTGGRLQTTTVAIKDPANKNQLVEVKDEEGGMRFVPEGSGMGNLWKLIKTFNNLKTVPFVMGDSNNRYYFRGQSFTSGDAETGNIWKMLYDLAPNEENKKPTDILSEVMNTILDQNGKAALPNTPDKWIDFRNKFTYKDPTGNPVLINKWGFWSLLRCYGLTEECITCLNHAIGFMGPFESFINAGAALQIIFDFPAVVSFFTLEKGYESLPDAVADDIRKMGGKIITGENIVSLTEEGNGISALGSTNSYNAKKVILAIPQKPLKKIMDTSPFLSKNEKFVTAVHSVQNMELSKVGLYFNERWWHSNPKINLTNGPGFTDLPIGSVYCFSQFPNDDGADKNYNGPAALTLYTDYTRGNFWKEMQNIGPHYSPEGVDQPANTCPASVNLVNEVLAQLKRLFGMEANETVPMPVLSTYRVWGENESYNTGDYDYGYHQYKVNRNDGEEVYPHISSPAQNVFVCNEAWSPEQGWVEGSLIMSDSVMQKGFNLPPFIPKPAEAPEPGRKKIKINKF
jgi:lysine 2-monooxygenase